MTLPFGIDMSRYQYSADGTQKPDFDKVNATCDFVAVRAGISWGYTDPWFAYSWAHIVKPRLAYHVIYPGEDAGRQVDHFLDIVQPEATDRLVLDMELDHGYSKARITQTVRDCMEYILDNTGRYPVIYSRASWVDAHLDVSRLPAEADWWLANYLARRPAPLYTPEKAPPPALPNGVSKWLIHQTGERGNGGAVGVRSYYVDTNRWNGTNQELLAFFGLAEPSVPEPPADKLFDAQVTTTPPNRLKTRLTPAGTVRPEADWLLSGEVVPVYETDATGWYRIEYETWASANWLSRLDTQPPADMLNIPPLWQRDPRWQAVKLGNSSLTIGSHGCLATCFSMVVGVMPDQFNARMKSVGGFIGPNIYWNMVEVAYPDVEYIKAIDCYYTPAPLDEIDALLAQGISVMVHVDFDVSTPAVEQHWVLVIGKQGDDYIINDPWTGETGSFRAAYGDPARYIYRIRAYKRN